MTFTEADVKAAATAGFKLGWVAACERALQEVKQIAIDAKEHGHDPLKSSIPLPMLAQMIAWVSERAPEDVPEKVEPQAGE